ncbi:alpha/beta hydrolase [Agromyces sp. H66]|uniref:alpha/beta fold hydrolase n=1 Tax=Agromyces sp. H66 TaxID=2529859 RepID=UPI0010A9F74E|nr:alpha/beta hydrolase [Agromyces sp. H66]
MVVGSGARPAAVAWRWVRRILVVLLITAVQIALVLVAAVLVVPPAAAIAIALATSVVVAAAWTWLRACRRRDLRHRSALAGAALTVASLMTLLVVLPSAPAPSAAPPGALRLADGTFLAVRTVEADAPSDAAPIVAVHGGPGVPWTVREEEVLARLATDRDLVVYDQIGAGASARLDDPADYTFERAVRDLEAVVDATGADRVTLLGHSWGAPVALGFAVRHPDRVERLVFLTPGAVPWDGVAQPPGAPQRRLSPGALAALYARALEPRNLFAYALTVIDPGVAHRFMPDAEADARYRELYLASAAGLVCDGHEVPDAPERLGHYANHGPGVEPGHPTGVTESSLERLAGHPVLILRPECDYLDAGIADEYARELPRSRATEVADSGHALLEERPAAVIAAIRAFLE